MQILPLGTVVKLKEGNQKLMIITRCPLYNQEGVIGYFDYAACIFLMGQIGQETCFFNQEDVAEVFYQGYVDETEKEYLKRYREEMKNIKYPKLKNK